MNPALTKAELLPLGSSRSVAVRAVVASRLDCPLGLMVSLAHDYHPDVRGAIASNPSAQRSVLAYLAADRNVEVVKAVIDNPSLPSDILDELSMHKKSGIRDAATQRLNGTTAAARRAASKAGTGEDAHVPEVAEHVSPGSLAMSSVSFVDAGISVPPRDALPFAGVGGGETVASLAPIADSGDEKAATPHDDDQAAPRWTRTAPVRGFRVSG
ncbi:hypothetical protein LGT39_08845 [Demequina sp. TTPB684]|uniref:hypothetical protein n=1 Tax=unclassified Demequina TaxID=2620311 RepID=UPI001CF4BC0B|nr:MULTISPECIES: hypothetical protein [unclassified Demequina]MCB2412952.1 hypothetical protein [Demequina sp. TTPB684]UPU88421.1 hypothetical protein LGT36_000400 [Demequina sp. TMPB413]